MSDEFDIMDEEEQTIVLDEDEMAGDDDIQIDDDDEGFDDEGDFDDEDLDLPPPKYRPDSNVYSVLVVLSFIAYVIALTVVLSEMQPYCTEDGFMWGMFK